MLRKLRSIVKQGKVLKNEPLKNHTSFHIGGKAKYFIIPNTCEELVELILYLNEINYKYYILGNGTNVLASDNGYDGIIIKLTQLNQIRKYNNYVQVFAGVGLNQLCLFCKENNISGMEDAYGIPGTVGGAVIMNASAYNFEMSNVVAGVLALSNGKIKYFSNADCGFEYRKSVFKKDIILSVDLKLNKGECDEKRMEYIMEMRKTFQPLNYPSAGSVFKRCDGVIVSKLLDDLGLKGRQVGGAKVSEKHAGFIINYNNATALDVKTLIKEIKSIVKEKNNIVLEEEIKYL